MEAKDARLPAVRVEPELREALEEITARDPDDTLANVIRRALREYVEKHRR